MSQLHAELTARGLTTPPSPRRPSKPIGKSSLHRILINPYYKGDVTYQGVIYPGKHEPPVPKEVWYQVQTVLDTHRSAMDATQIHDHYLKGTVFCGACGSRCVARAAGRGHLPVLRVLWPALGQDRLHPPSHAHREGRRTRRAEVPARPDSRDDANRRLCNQAFFTAIYIDEDEQVRVGYARPFDALVDTEMQKSALAWAHEAQNEDKV